MSGDDSEARPNPFDPSRLRLTQRFGEGQDVRQVLVSVRKPHRQEFIRTHPDAEMSIEVALLELREDQQNYLVDPALQPYLPGEAVSKRLVTAITMRGVPFIWPIRLPDDHGRLDPWNTVALEAAELAKSKWTRLMANRPAGTYDVLEATATYPEPTWPDVSLQRLLELAFKNRFIDDLDHPILRQLRGEICEASFISAGTSLVPAYSDSRISGPHRHAPLFSELQEFGGMESNRFADAKKVEYGYPTPTKGIAEGIGVPALMRQVHGMTYGLCGLVGIPKLPSDNGPKRQGRNLHGLGHTGRSTPRADWRRRVKGRGQIHRSPRTFARAERGSQLACGAQPVWGLDRPGMRRAA
jgi:hypothetical protein